MCRLAILPFLVLLAFTPVSYAFKPAMPTRHDVLSPSGKYVLDLDPATKTHNIYLAANRNKPLWSFSQPLGIGDVFLSDSGKVVAMVAGRFGHGEGDCVIFRNSTGRMTTYSFGEICPNPRVRLPFEPGPIGVISYIWRDDLVRDNSANTLQVITTGWHEFTFSMDTGEILSRRFLAGNVLYRPWFYLLLVLIPIGFWMVARSGRSMRQRNSDAIAIARSVQA